LISFNKFIALSRLFLCLSTIFLKCISLIPMIVWKASKKALSFSISVDT